MKSPGLAWSAFGASSTLALSEPSGVFTGIGTLTEADAAEFVARWHREHALGRNAHRVMVLPGECTITRRCCSYCRCEMTGIRCGNCGAPMTGES